MDTMKSIDVTRKRKNDRGAEAYDFPQQNEATVKSLKRRRLNQSDNDSSTSSSNASSSKFRKRSRKFRNKKRKFTEPMPKVLPDITSSVDGDDIDGFANELAQHLEEQNVELIHRVVSVIGE